MNAAQTSVQLVMFDQSWQSCTACREDGSGLQPLNDTFMYSTTNDEWHKVETAGKPPAARNAAVACLVEQNQMLLHGGWEPFRNTFSDTFLLHCWCCHRLQSLQKVCGVAMPWSCLCLKWLSSSVFAYETCSASPHQKLHKLTRQCQLLLFYVCALTAYTRLPMSSWILLL